MSIEREVLKQVLDYHLILAEVNRVIDAKVQAIKDQEFEKAARLREQEVKLKQSLPTLDDFKTMRNKLDEE